MRLGRLWILVV